MQAKKMLQQYFGYSCFSRWQEEIIENIINRKNTLGILPTGGRKIALFSNSCSPSPRNYDCYFPPYFSHERPGRLTLPPPISQQPLLIVHLIKKNYRNRCRLIRNGAYKLVYVAPERFESAYFIDCSIQLTSL